MRSARLSTASVGNQMQSALFIPPFEVGPSGSLQVTTTPHPVGQASADAVDTARWSTIHS
jgi:hypothetical protein